MWEAVGAMKGGFGAREQRRTGAHIKTIWSFPLFSLYKTESNKVDCPHCSCSVRGLCTM
jgi:hypothetical protein